MGWNFPANHLSPLGLRLDSCKLILIAISLIANYAGYMGFNHRLVGDEPPWRT
jgi:hypothetical protein